MNSDHRASGPATGQHLSPCGMGNDRKRDTVGLRHDIQIQVSFYGTLFQKMVAQNGLESFKLLMPIDLRHDRMENTGRLTIQGNLEALPPCRKLGKMGTWCSIKSETSVILAETTSRICGCNHACSFSKSPN